MERERIEQKTVVYAEPEGEPLHLDVIRPANRESHPVLLVVHGGGWCSGHRMEKSAESHRLARAGYVVCNLDYRLAPRHPYPAACEDLRAAASWVRTHIEDFGGDADRLGAYGVSAGGHLVMLLAAAADAPLRCAVGWGAPMDFHTNAVTPRYRSYALAFLGACRHDDPALYDAVSPAHHLTARTPPLLLIHGAEDDTVPPAQTLRMAEVAARHGASIDTLILDGAGHAPGNPRDPVMAMAWQHLLAFFERHLAQAGTREDTDAR